MAIKPEQVTVFMQLSRQDFLNGLEEKIDANMLRSWLVDGLCQVVIDFPITDHAWADLRPRYLAAGWQKAELERDWLGVSIKFTK